MRMHALRASAWYFGFIHSFRETTGRHAMRDTRTREFGPGLLASPHGLNVFALKARH